VRDISKWFEAKSSDQDSAGIRKHLDNLIGRLTSSPAARRRDPISLTEVIRTVPDPEHPDEPVNSL
jgi:hypothetical protein